MSLVENNTPKKFPPQLEPWRIKPGEVRNPSGRPKGSRNKLCEAYLAAMHEDFLLHGVSVIERVREKKPEVYLACVAALVPKQKQEIQTPFGDLSDEELEELERFLRQSRAKNITPTIEAEGLARQSIASPDLAAQGIASPRPQGRNNGSTNDT